MKFIIKGGISTGKEIIDIGHCIPKILTLKDLCECLIGWENEITTFQVFGSRMSEHEVFWVTPCCKTRHWHHVNRTGIPARVLRCELCDQMFDAERLEKIMNKAQKGNRYRKKVMDWFREIGYEVEIVEKNYQVRRGVYVKRDLWGADLIAKSEYGLIFINVKSNRANVSAGKKEFRDGVWPPFVKLWVVLWEPYAKEPEIFEVENDG